jgi:hypothetical protein
MSLRRLTPRHVLAVALLAACGPLPYPAPALADQNSSPFALAFEHKHPRLLPVLHATERVGFPEDGWQYDYATKGYFKVADKTVARLPAFSGHADSNPEQLRLAVERSTRRTIRAAARRHRTNRVILILVHHITETAGPTGVGDRQTVTQQVFMTIPPN